MYPHAWVLQSPCQWVSQHLCWGARDHQVITGHALEWVWLGPETGKPLVVLDNRGGLAAIWRALHGEKIRGWLTDTPDPLAIAFGNIAKHVPWQWTDFSWAQWRVRPLAGQPRSEEQISLSDPQGWEQLVHQTRAPAVWLWGWPADQPPPPTGDIPCWVGPHPDAWLAHPPVKKVFWQVIQQQVNPFWARQGETWSPP